MRFFIFTFLLLGGLICKPSHVLLDKKKIFDPDQPYLRGHPSSYVQKVYTAVDSSGIMVKGRLTDEAGDWAEEKVMIDTGGFAFETHPFTKDGIAEDVSYTIYDKKNRVIEHGFRNGENKVSMKNVYTFNDDGSLAERATYREDMQGRFTYTYNKKGEVTETKLYDRNNQLSSMYTRTYDEQGNMVKIVTKKPDGTVTATQTMEYDANGNLLLDKEYDQNGNYARRFENTYNASNFRTKKIWYVGKQKYRESEYIYDSSDNLVQSTLWEYVGEQRYEVEKKAYTNDAQGNWTRKVVYHQGKATFIYERAITYYP